MNARIDRVAVRSPAQHTAWAMGPGFRSVGRIGSRRTGPTAECCTAPVRSAISLETTPEES